jgi:hypothetical protein
MKIAPGRILAISLLMVWVLPGCGVLRPGIPDADPPFPPPPKREPCEVWVTQFPERTARCISREHATRDLCRATPNCSPY